MRLKMTRFKSGTMEKSPSNLHNELMYKLSYCNLVNLSSNILFKILTWKTEASFPY